MLFLCNLWPWLAGGLLGWLLSGWLARRLKYGEAPVEKIVEKTVEVEKVVDNPKHLSLISQLENENRQIAELKMRVSEFEKSEADIADLIKKEGVSANGGLRSQFAHLISGFRTKISDHETKEPEVVEKIVEKEVEKLLDNPEHLKRIKFLEEENEQISGLQTTITALENRRPTAIEKVVEIEVEKLIDNPEHLTRIRLLEDELDAWKRGPSIDLPAARASGIVIKAEDDFTAIEGIGPKISELIHADGIQTFTQLSDTEPAHIQKILDQAGSNFQMANPGTWPDQANLAASNRWSALKTLQDILDGGVYPDLSVERAALTSSNAEDAAKIEALEVELAAYRLAENQAVSIADIEAAKAAGFKIRRQGNHDDFTVIEGIGPKIHELIHAENIHTYSQLASTSIAVIQKILDDAGTNFVLAEPDTWPAQSVLAAKNQWMDLSKWQDELDGGKE